jgi:hypothetical protein
LKLGAYRVLLLAALGLYIGLLSREIAASRAVGTASPDSISRALLRSSNNPLLWTEYAKYSLGPSGEADLGKGFDGYKRAAILNPFDTRNWDGLAAAYVQSGDSREPSRLCVPG